MGKRNRERRELTPREKQIEKEKEQNSYYSLDWAAKYLDLTEAELKECIVEREIVAIETYGGHISIRKRDLDKWFWENEIENKFADRKNRKVCEKEIE